MKRLFLAVICLLVLATSAISLLAGVSTANAQSVPVKYDSQASTNSTLVRAGFVQLHALAVINTTAALYYLKFYDLAVAPTCGTSTPVWKVPVPFGTAGTGGDVTIAIPDGLQFFNGMGFCLTGGPADNDTTVAATGVTINLGVKQCCSGAFTVSGPLTGTAGAASSNFTVTLGSGSFSGAQTITISDGAQGGTFTPSVGSPGTSTVTVTPAAAATSFTFTYNAAVGGPLTLTFSNGQGWTNPAPLPYTASGGASTATLNPSDKGANITLAGSNLIATNASNAGSTYDAARSTTSHASGKYYFEFTYTAIGVNAFTIPVGIGNASMVTTGPPGPGFDGNLSISSYGGNTTLTLGSTNIGTVPSIGAGQTAGIAVDIDNHLIYLWRGVPTGWNAGTANPATQTGGISFASITGPYFVTMGIYRSTAVTGTMNFGGSAYAYTPPAGFGNW